MTIQIPSNVDIFKRVVTEKIQIYCDTKIWPYEYDQFTAWLNNFDNDIDEYVALQILDNLIIRSHDMAKASYSRLFDSTLRQHLIEHSNLCIGTIEEWKEKLKNGRLNTHVRIAPVKLINDSGESGSTVYRKLSPEVDTDRYSYSKAHNPPQIIILIDDLIGSGQQFIKFSEEFDLSEKLKSIHVIYCPLIAYEAGIDKVREKYPKLHILPAEYLDRTDGLFYDNGKGLFKNDQKNTTDSVKKHLTVMHKKYAPKMKNWLGRDDVALSIVFEWGCPNQAPALLFMDKSINNSDWQQLFGRRS